MSGIFSDVNNYGGRQPDNTSYIKQFVTSFGPVASWIYKRINNVVYITPQDKTKNVLIEKDLIVNGAIINPSDQRVKINIKELEDDRFNNITKLMPKSYNYIYDENKKEHYGLIAQQLQDVYPELVTKCMNNDTEIMGINYIELIPVIIGKMKLMEQEIQQLKLRTHKYETE
jgi:hypothetical protein